MFVMGHSVLIKACLAAGIEFDQNKAHGAAYDTQKEAELFCYLLNRYTTFCGIPEPIKIEIDYNNKKAEE